MLGRFFYLPVFSCLFLFASLACAEVDRPNILWITAEDMSATLGCYGDNYALTPNIDRLAEESVRYTHAFATAPVCSPVRSCLITGCYATSLGTHNMRSAYAIPKVMRGFPALLRDLGYHTTNNVKTDYNTSSWQRIVQQSWNESSDSAHWRKRSDEKQGQPFFSIFNLMTTHQSRTMVWNYERFADEVQSRLPPHEIHDPANAPLPPYYPDTSVIRRTVARFYDCVTVMDQEVGAILDQLKEDDLADETIVFFYSDHGSGMPRHKRALLDSGMHVPLLIRFPEKYQHLAPAEPGESTDRLVSFVDFGPTVLKLAGLEIPSFMQGQPFLGKQSSKPRDYVFGHRDRVDEVIDLARSVRDRRYLYIRNYMPHLGYNQPTAWPDLGEIRHEFYRLATSNKMTEPQWHFAGPTRPIEELYDCENDPHNLHNLAGSAKHQAELNRFRKVHRQHLVETSDLGFIPEPVAAQVFRETAPWNAVRSDRVTMHLDAIKVASLVGRSDEESFLNALKSDQNCVRYWGAIGLSASPTLSSDAKRVLGHALTDNSAAVRIVAAGVLGRYDQNDDAIASLIKDLQHEDLTVVLHAARTVELLGEKARAAIPQMRIVVERSEQLRPSKTPATFVLSGEQDLAMFASFAANAFLSHVDEKN